MQPKRPENVILVGFMGSGKTAIGKLASKLLKFQFLDTDQIIVERTGRQISEIFSSEGEAFFRKLETTVLESLSHMSRCVVSTGGGAVLSERNRLILRSLGFVVLLTASEETLYERISRNSKRPLLQTENPRATLSTLLAARQHAYASAAEFTLDTTHLTHSAAAEALEAATRTAFAWTRKA
jgi:shikimate kinase